MKVNFLRIFPLLTGLLLIAQSSFGQYSYKDQDEFKKYRQAVELYQKNNFAQVIPVIDEFLEENNKVYQSEFRNIRVHAELLKAQSTLYNEDPDGEEMLVNFIDKYQPDPQANEALYNLADYYFRSRKYDLAIKYYNRIGQGTLPADQAGEVAFKLGYSHFVKKEFEDAMEVFQSGKNVRGTYYHDLNYYYGMAAYFEGDYDTAIRSWQIAQQDKTYERLIPYYLTQIYFSNGDYQKLISYAVPYAKESGIQNQKEINHLIGQSYFELGDFKNAQPYLEEYESNSGTMRAEDFYQLAYVQYKNGDYEKAIPNFRELSNEKSDMGQTAMYYLAESYLQSGNKASARNAFYNVVQYPENMPLRENALFNYAKLSAELDYDIDAINAFSKFLATSKYYNEAQRYMADVLVNTNNYKKSIEILESINDLSPDLKTAYQKVTLRQANLDLKENKLDEALIHFNKSLKYAASIEMQAEAYFWIGEILNRKKNYPESEAALNKYLALAKANQSTHTQVNPAFASYIQGYNYIRSGEHQMAVKALQNSINEGRRISFQDPTDKKRLNDIMGDAYIRIGDNYFQMSRYNQASEWYQKAANEKVSGYDYALYQYAQILALQGNTSRQTTVLDRLVQEAPSSKYADIALLEKADALIQSNQMAQARNPLQVLVQKYKGKSELINKAYFKLGLIEYNLGNSDQALNYYRQILSNNPTSQESTNALAAIEEIYVIDRGNPDAYFQVLESIPGMKVGQRQKDSLQYSVAGSYYNNGEYEKAVTAFGEYLNRYPKGFYALDAYYNRAESNVLLKRFDAALSDYENVIQRGNSSYYRDAVRKAAIIAFNDQEDFTRALKYYALYETLVTDEEERFKAQVNALNSAFKIKDQAAILKFADKVKDNPLANDQQRSLAYFTLAKSKIQAGNSAEALRDLEFVVGHSNNEQTAESRFLIARILYENNNLTEAAVKVKEAYTQNGAYPQWVAKSLLLNARILIKQDDLFNAKAAVEAVIDNFPGDPEIIAEANALHAEIKDLEAKSSRIEKSPQNGELELDYGNQ
ncbi:tetratricopeptide repeat protein [Membranicola marinus]|uniref:Tetratricopeptide repeat protein n=1 Tax=Membranihabitans marinus TaxID=1227546 RepID=A0A953HL61_9BACT|nr:tetratricopeptide repeat protein [Membranihabitans marinus]MBY5957094.1 tetratricopeptide repeat protein [Membranihabitans marinus]